MLGSAGFCCSRRILKPRLAGAVMAVPGSGNVRSLDVRAGSPSELVKDGIAWKARKRYDDPSTSTMVGESAMSHAYREAGR